MPVSVVIKCWQRFCFRKTFFSSVFDTIFAQFVILNNNSNVHCWHSTCVNGRVQYHSGILHLIWPYFLFNCIASVWFEKKKVLQVFRCQLSPKVSSKFSRGRDWTHGIDPSQLALNAIKSHQKFTTKNPPHSQPVIHHSFISHRACYFLIIKALVVVYILIRLIWLFSSKFSVNFSLKNENSSLAPLIHHIAFHRTK